MRKVLRLAVVTLLLFLAMFILGYSPRVVATRVGAWANHQLGQGATP